MKKFITNKFVLYILGIILFCLIWFIVSIWFDKSNMIIPTPFKTFGKVFELLKDQYTYACLGNTLLRVIIGFTISFAIAFILGVIAGNNTHIETLLQPTVQIFQSVPTAALVFLFVVLTTPKNAPIFVTVMMSTPILYESIKKGIIKVDENSVKAARIDGANLFKTNLFIKIPLAFPYIGVGILSSFSLSFKVEIMAEVITGYTKNGLGSVIRACSDSDPTNITPIFAYSVIAVLIAMITTLIANFFKQKLKRKVDVEI